MKREIKIAELLLVIVCALFASNLQAAPRTTKVVKSVASDAANRAQLNKRLVTAIVNGDLSKVKIFLSRGTQINVPDSQGNTPFAVAVARGNVPIVSFLLAKRKWECKDAQQTRHYAAYGCCTKRLCQDCQNAA